MELYKSRNFSELFQDTFEFIKLNGRHLFKHFFILTGVFILILAAFGYLLTKFVLPDLFPSFLNTMEMELTQANDYDSIIPAIILGFATFGIVSALVIYSYIPIYLNLYSKKMDTNFTSKELVDMYKSVIGKLFIFLFCSILVGFPVVVASGITGVILTITLIGILGLPFLAGMVALFYQMTLMEYLEGKQGIWDSFGYSWSLLFSKFWPSIGSIGLFYVMFYILQFAINMIPNLVDMANIYGDTSTENYGIIALVVAVVFMVFSFIVNACMQLVVQLNQGIIFYSLKETKENINSKSVIDQIGSGE
ncbi:MAG: hypothetical protein BM564_05740 [Bacteroidetes bacterium MedPE-SWsnd-G2]|nr:MAG: hypothetical protein BM564_05740 [Bacteroidetes bacterium MedPE-SWsnd-G2]